jgi:signal transduction histidine kinase
VAQAGSTVPLYGGLAWIEAYRWLGRREPRRALFGGLVIAHFLVDWLSPPGVLDGVGYPFLLPLLFAEGRRRVVLLAAVLCTALTVLANFLNGTGGIGQLMILNRAVAIAGIWIMAVFLVQRLRLETDLKRAGDAAEAASRAKTELLANMSHELRTPLNAVIGFSEVIGAEMFGPLDRRYAAYADDINQSGKHLLALISDLLDISRAETGQLVLKEEVVDVASVVESSIRCVSPQATEAGVSLAVELAANLPLLRADELKFRQVLVNLLSNGIKFTPAGGRVALAGRLEAARTLSLVVSDTGVGMAAEDIPVAFEAFRQLDSSLTRKHEGAGLGLALSKRLVELHGGSIEIKSTVGHGTEVTVRFPPTRVEARPFAAAQRRAVDPMCAPDPAAAR